MTSNTKIEIGRTVYERGYRKLLGTVVALSDNGEEAQVKWGCVLQWIECRDLRTGFEKDA